MAPRIGWGAQAQELTQASRQGNTLVWSANQKVIAPILPTKAVRTGTAKDGRCVVSGSSVGLTPG